MLDGSSNLVWRATTTDINDVKNGPLANLGADLGKIYSEFYQYSLNGSQGAFQSSRASLVNIRGNTVGVSVQGTGDFNTFRNALTSLGLQTTIANASAKRVDGFLPISQLPALATQAQVLYGSPLYRPFLDSMGSAVNQAESTMYADLARNNFGLTGAGVKIGVLSDSVNQFQGGLADSVATGDLPRGSLTGGSNVQVLVDGGPGSTDEGRAMLEQIYDIAPGASLAFATVGNSPSEFAANIRALAAAGCTVIVDDVRFSDEPFFQDGIITDAVNDVTARGVTYLASAGNRADGGYLSQFRGVSTTVAGVGAGRFMNFDGTGATTTTLLPIQVFNATPLVMQFAQPFYTNGGVTSDVDIFVLDASGAVVAQGNANNLANQQPLEQTGTINPGLYSVAIQVKSGPDPSNVVFYSLGSRQITVSHRFGSAGETFYPTGFGHTLSPNNISVGAVPWWGAPPYSNPATVNNEPYSSAGPGLRLFNYDGSAATKQYVLKPDLSAPDFNNTSFFIPGVDIDTTQVVAAGLTYGNEPTIQHNTLVTPTNLDDDTLPNFSGTSSAAPNLAAVVALMKQASPTITRAQIVSALIATARPLNGAAKGVWDVQGGYGLVDANAAIASIRQAGVASITPGGNATITAAPSVITVTFTKPVIFSSITADDLKVVGPNGAIVTTGTPIAVGDPNFPTVVQFPITITPAPGLVANGTYAISIATGAIIAADNTPVQQADQFFNLQQTTAPRVTNTTINGRVITIQFNQPLNPASVNASSAFILRAGALNGPFGSPNNQIVSTLPGATMVYNPATFQVVFNLNGVDQTLLPSDHYAIVVTQAVTDAVGNPLNGAFNGVFPSGVTPSVPMPFVQDLGNIFVQAPSFANVRLTTLTDSGVKGDQNTNIPRPGITGQVLSMFPGTIAGVTVYIQFNGIIHPGTPSGTFNLAANPNGRGIIGTFDAVAVTDSNGLFTIDYPLGAAELPEGLNLYRLVAVAPPEIPGLEGLSSSFDGALRLDRTRPYIGALPGTQVSSIPQNSQINSLTTLQLQVIDPVNPQSLGSRFAVNTQLSLSALDLVAATTTSNYSLTQIVPNGQGGYTQVDRSSFIASATFTSTTSRVFSYDPYTGFITLNFRTGLQAGRYVLTVKSAATTLGGIQDAAGNPLSNEFSGVAQNFTLDFDIQPTPAYITGFNAYSPNGSGGVAITGPRAFYEIPAAGAVPRATAAPNAFTIDFSNSLLLNNPDGSFVNYNNLVQLLRSANSPTAAADGDFGDLGFGNTNGFTRVTSGFQVQLVDSVAGAAPGQYGYRNRLIITVDGPGLPADYYRIYLPNDALAGTAIRDIYNNQLDGEFLGYQDATGKFVNLMPTGQLRGSGAAEQPSLTGDGVQGGAFTTGFVVVPNGNIFYARPDYVDDPLIASDDPDGSLAKPYAALAPEAIGSDFNGNDLNNIANFGPRFNPALDRNNNGRFDRSALFAAQQATLGIRPTGERGTPGPAVVSLLPALAQRNPITGVVSQQTFVLQAPAGSDPIANDASTSVPALTTLVFQAGSTLKMLNASLFVQNQGSAVQILGGPNPNQRVTITSYKDDSVGGDTNRDGTDSAPAPGDFGGIVFRNYTQQNRISTFTGQIPTTGVALADNRLKGISGTSTAYTLGDALSGSDDVMSILSFMNESFGGGAVPATNGTRYDGVTLYNSRPAIVNSSISQIGGVGALQAPISGDLDSFREDYIGRGPLIRNDTFVANGLNGIYVRAELNGVARISNAIANRTSTPAVTFDDPYPYLLTSRLEVGTQFQVETGGGFTSIANRLNVQPGMMVKFQRGAAIQVVNTLGSLNVGERTYINGFDLDNSYGPFLSDGVTRNPDFVPNKVGDAKVLFTSLYDDVATTSYFDPVSQLTTTIVAALASLIGGSGALQPTANAVNDLARWGGISVVSGAVAVIDEAQFRYGGGSINTATGTGVVQALELAFNNGQGANVSVTNNDFSFNADVPINIQPNGLFAGDMQRPLQSGAPFIHGNVFVGNGLNGVGVANTGNLPRQFVNLTNDSVWTGSDFTYILRQTINLAGGILPAPPTTQLVAEPSPVVSLTLQSTPAGTVLADGTAVDLPGVPLIIKTLGGAPSISSTGSGNSGVNVESLGGAGFMVGVDNLIDPPTDSLVDTGAFSQIRIVGIGANQTLGQARVPVIITSVHDSTVGTTVRNVVMNQVIPNDATAPAAGDGGLIYFGGNSLTDYNMQDVRDGNVIDNADIRYMSRIEQQGGGIIYVGDTNADNSFTDADNVYNQKLGLNVGGLGIGFLTQYNQAKKLTISNSNLDSFRDFAVVAHPGGGALYVLGSSTGAARSSVRGEPTHTFLYNNTFSNMPNQTAVQIVSENQGDDSPSRQSPAMAVALNNTFYNVGTGIRATSGLFTTTNPNAKVSLLAMNNIFSTIGVNNGGAGGSAIIAEGQAGQNFTRVFSDAQYNLFFNVFNNNYVTGDTGMPNNQPVFGDPLFRNAAARDFNLLPGSAAIDASRSEIGPISYGDMLYPAVTQDPTNPNATPIRNQIGSVNPNGGSGGAPLPQNIVTLPGYPIRGFLDQFVASARGSAGSTALPNAQNAGTNFYTPVTGERDILGNLRVKSPTATTVGFGSRPYFDIGAYEYIVQNPPVVIDVTAASANGVTSLYSVGGIAGSNAAPTTVGIAFNQQINPSTLNSLTVLLLASGGDGIFGNGNSSADTAISLQGRLAFDSNSKNLVINTAGLITTNDVYRIVLKGTGSQVIRNTDGTVLDGENLDANGNQRALPSGDQFPGGDFQVTFALDTNSPQIVAGSFRLSPNSDTSAGRSVTKITQPTFIGNVTDIFPPVNAQAGLNVFIDISTRGDGNFDLIAAGTGTTAADGSFSVTLNSPLPNTPLNVGPDGIQGTNDDTYSLARLRVVDQSGNASNQISDPLESFLAKGAVTRLVVDTVSPHITAISPTANTVATVDASGRVIVTVTFDKNIDLATLNNNSIQVIRSGGDGSFTDGNEVALAIDPSSFVVNYLNTPSGAETVQFALAGQLANDIYQITFFGTGPNPVTDIAKNPLAPLGSNSPGNVVNGPITITSPVLANNIFVDANATGLTPDGSRANPYPTITAGLAAAVIGDQVLVLPGTYRENVFLKAGVRLLSADISSTDDNYIPGAAQQTLIYGSSTNNATFGAVTVTAANLTTVAGIDTEISGFSIITPLIGNSVTGFIDTTSFGVFVLDSDVLIDKNYIINAGTGIGVTVSGTGSATPRIQSNGIIGNINGMVIAGSTSATSPVEVVNNTFAVNTVGLVNASNFPGTQALVFNNIFYSNHDLTAARNGTGIQSFTANTLSLRNNLFQGNGRSQALSSDDVQGVFADFDPNSLGATPGLLGNFVGNAGFVAARDPRPNGDTPAVFFLDGNYDLSLQSAAIDSALDSFAPARDFLNRGRVRIPGRGFFDSGPADIGAFEFRGTNGIAAGGQLLRVVTTSLSADGTATASSFIDANQVPTYIDVNISSNVDPSSVQASDLVLSGDGLSSVNPAHATSFSWIDGHTVRFFLTGGFNTSGTVKVNIAAGAITDKMGRGIAAFSNAFQIGAANTVGNGGTPTTPGIAPVLTPIFQPQSPTKGKGAKAAAKAAAKAKAAAAAKAKAQAKAAAKAKAKAQAAAKAKAKAQAKAAAKAKAAAAAKAKAAAKALARKNAKAGTLNG